MAGHDSPCGSSWCPSPGGTPAWLDAMRPQEPAIVVAARQLHEDQKRPHQRGQDDEAPTGPVGNHRVGHEQADHRLQTVVRHPRAESQHRVVERQKSQTYAPGHAKLGAHLQVEEHQRREDHQLAQERDRKRHLVRQQSLSGVAGHHRRVVQIEARHPEEGGDRGKRLGESRPARDDFDAPKSLQPGCARGLPLAWESTKRHHEVPDHQRRPTGNGQHEGAFDGGIVQFRRTQPGADEAQLQEDRQREAGGVQDADVGHRGMGHCRFATHMSDGTAHIATSRLASARCVNVGCAGA